MSEDDNLFPSERERGIFYVHMGINWEWSYFHEREKAEAFYAWARENGYQASLREIEEEFQDGYERKVTIPAGSFCVHWRAKGPTWI